MDHDIPSTVDIRGFLKGTVWTAMPSSPADVVDLFLARAAAAPDHPAIVWGSTVVSYGAFEARVRAFASIFAQHPEPRVLIALAPGVNVYASIFAAGMAGGFHTPVSPASPLAKIASIAKQLEPNFIVAETDLAGALREIVPSASTINPSDVDVSSRLAGRGTRHELAYVLFTSGTTGEPKGVKVSRDALAHYVRWLETWHITAADRISQQPNIAFDISMTDIFGALCYGATLYPLELDGDRLMPARFIQRHAITVWNSTPSVASLMMRAGQMRATTLGSVRLFNFCGEPLYREHVEALFAAVPGAIVQNTYGPTETTIAVTSLALTRDNYAAHCQNSVALGTPLPGMDIVLAGPTGQQGEIVIVGPQLAAGYWNDPEKTEANFRAVSSMDQRRGYFTGDWAELFGKDLYFRERMDLQVKVRGHRVELDEVVAAIRACGHSVACVIKRQDALAALIEHPEDVALDPSELRRRLGEKLDEHAVPHWLVSVPHIPRNENDKIDRRAAAVLLEASIGARNA